MLVRKSDQKMLLLTRNDCLLGFSETMSLGFSLSDAMTVFEVPPVAGTSDLNLEFRAIDNTATGDRATHSTTYDYFIQRIELDIYTGNYDGVGTLLDDFDNTWL